MSTATNSWLTGSVTGLRKLVEHKDRIFVLLELIQNAWDEDSSKVEVTLEPIEGSRGRAKLIVKDDNPNGFKDISHSYTLFAESAKKYDPEKRGRFNLGEKLVLALCDSATITSVHSAVEFCSDGTRKNLRTRTDKGTTFEAVIRITKAQIEEVADKIKSIFPPKNITTYFNGTEIKYRNPVKSFKHTLPTLIADTEGNLTPTARKTTVELYEVLEDETPMIYEMGIPVVESSSAYHINVLQKIPLNSDRDNVTPAYYRNLITAVVNNNIENIPQEEISKSWVTTALESPDIDPETTVAIVEKRFGDKVVSFSIKDQEANHRAAMHGYVVVSGNTLSKAAWANIKEAEAIKPAHAYFETPKAYSNDPNAKPVNIIPKEQWTIGMQEVADLTLRLHQELLNGRSVDVNFVMAENFSACYGKSNNFFVDRAVFDYSLKTLGHEFFDKWETKKQRLIRIIIHEFAHHYSASHLSDEYMRGLQELGASLVVLVEKNPNILKKKILQELS